MRISDWSSDVCSSDLVDELDRLVAGGLGKAEQGRAPATYRLIPRPKTALAGKAVEMLDDDMGVGEQGPVIEKQCRRPDRRIRSEEHTSELQSLMRISYAVFCLKKKTHMPKRNNKFTTQSDTKQN